jgi:hypothetical protein
VLQHEAASSITIRHEQATVKQRAASHTSTSASASTGTQHRRSEQSKTAHGRASQRAPVTPLAEWLAPLEREAGDVPVAAAFAALRALPAVDGREVEVAVPALLPHMHRLAAASMRDRRKATSLDALGTALAAHPALHVAVRDHTRTTALIDAVVDAAARDAVTYTNSLCTAQLATAQPKLDRYCWDFWQTLAQQGLGKLGPRQVRFRAAAQRATFLKRC